MQNKGKILIFTKTFQGNFGTRVKKSYRPRLRVRDNSYSKYKKEKNNKKTGKNRTKKIKKLPIEGNSTIQFKK